MPSTKRTLIIAGVLLAIAVAAVAVASYHEIAIRFAPRKRAATVRTAAALTADSLFWRTFHSGDYDGIPRRRRGAHGRVSGDPKRRGDGRAPRLAAQLADGGAGPA